MHLLHLICRSLFFRSVSVCDAALTLSMVIILRLVKEPQRKRKREIQLRLGYLLCVHIIYIGRRLLFTYTLVIYPLSIEFITAVQYFD